ncbi:MAG: STAS domain-containing protein [Acidimicrobiales bacterium]|jgi:ABC-type transporter Mla MlaB component
MRASAPDIVSTDPVLVLTVDPPSSIRCVGTLDGVIGHHLVDAVDELLEARPPTISIDIEKLRLADSDAAAPLSEVQRRAKQAGTTIHWHGVGADHLRQAPDLGYRASLTAA